MSSAGPSLPDSLKKRYMSLKTYTPPTVEDLVILPGQSCLQAASGGMFGDNGEAGSSLTEDDPFNL